MKRFIDGPGYYCDDYDHVAGKFKWRCNKAGAARMLVYKGGANNTTQPLLGWHANGCVEIKILRHVRAESSHYPPRHRRDACSMAWRCRFLIARPSQDGRVIAEK